MKRSKRWLLASAALGVASATAPSALAWKPETHVYLAKKAWEDAVDDGYVKIYATDFAAGRAQCSGGLRSLGGDPRGFMVQPQVLQALRDHPEKYFAGVLGPDAYPDIVSGQERIHPPGAGDHDTNANGPGTDAWLQQLWASAWSAPSPDLAQLAWVLGFLDHAAGDVYAHTFMNTFAGGIFDFTTENALKHVTLEGYVEQRTPDLGLPHSRLTTAPDLPELHALVAGEGIDGIEDFIVENTADIPGSSPDEQNKVLSVPYVLAQLDAGLTRQIDDYTSFDASLRHDHDEAAYLASPAGVAAELAWACNQTSTCPDPSYSTSACPADRFPRGDWACAGLTLGGGIVAWQLAEQALADTLWPAVAAQAPAEDFIWHQTDRRDAVRRARRAWVTGSHDAGTSIFFTQNRLFDRDQFDEAYVPFKNELQDVALGVPQPVNEALVDLQRFLALPQTTIDGLLAQVKDDVLQWALQTAFHMSVEQARERFTKPHVYLNQLFAGTSPGLTVLSANKIMRVEATSPAHCPVDVPGGGRIDLAGACDLVTGAPAATFTAEPTCDANGQQPFPAAMNAVTMIKLSMLAPSEIDRFQREVMRVRTPVAVGGAGRYAPANAMLGFAATIDGSNQWSARRNALSWGAAPMLAARDCSVYAQLFVDQRPDFTRDGVAIPYGDQRPFPHVFGTAWEPAQAQTCGQPTPAPGPGGPVIALAPSDAHVAYGGMLTFRASEPVYVDRPSVGTVDTSAGPTSSFVYHAPASPLSSAATVSVHTSDGRSAAQLVHFDSPLQGALHRDYRRPQAFPTPMGDPALHAGDRAVLTALSAGRAMTWTVVSGPGRIGDAAVEQRFAATMRAHETRMKGFATQMHAQPPAPPSRAQALAGAQRVLAERRAYLASQRVALASARKEVETARATYFAPEQLAHDDVVVLRGTSADGKTTTIAIRLAAPPPPLVVKAPRSVRAGQAIAVAVEGNVPVRWSVVGAPVGTMGDPRSQDRARLVSTQVQPFLQRLHGYDAQLAREKDPARRAAIAEARAKELFAGLRAVAPALAQVAEIDQTYHAPTALKLGTKVTLRATATDGTGRTADVTVDVTP